MLDIVFFAVLALILIFKLRSILGRTDEELRRRDSRSFGKGSKNVVDITDQVEISPIPDSRPVSPMNAVVYYPSFVSSDPIEGSIIDLFCSVSKMIHGVTPVIVVAAATEVLYAVLDAYNAGDLSPISGVVAPDIFQLFSRSLNAKRSAGLSDKMMLVRIATAKIVSVKASSDSVEVAVLFKTNQIHYTEDSSSKIVLGDKDVCVDVSEVWSFVAKQNKKNLGSWSWILVSIVDNASFS